MARYFTLLIDLTLGTSPNFGWKTRRYVQKWHFQYKTSDISETKRSRTKVTTGDKSCDRVNFALLFRRANFFHNRHISHTFCWSATKFGNVGSGQSKLIPRISWILVRGSYNAATCTSPSLIHLQSGFSTTSLCLTIVLMFFLFTALSGD